MGRNKLYFSGRTPDFYGSRFQKEEQRWQKEGAQEKNGILFHLDRLMDYSGMKEKYPGACAESYLFAVIILVAVGILLGVFTGISLMWTLAGSILLSLLLYTGLRMAADRTYNRIEEGMFAFINALSTESKSSDDLISILEASIRSVCEPLQVRLARCCLEARNTGKIELALHHLELSAENLQFRRVIRNLSMCYRTDADYVKVIDQCRVGLKEHIAAREERKVIMSTGKIEVIQLVGLGAVTLYMIGNIIGEGNVIVYLGSFLLGRIVLFYLIAVMSWCIMDAVLANGRD